MIKAAEKLYYILILSFILPSGNLFFIPVKLLLCGAILLATVLSGDYIKFDKITWLIVVIFAALLMWTLIALLNGYVDTTVQCLSLFLSMLIIVWLTYLFVSNKVIKIDSAFKCLQIVAITLIIFKFICEGVFLSNILSYDEVLNLYYKVFNTQLTSLHFSLGRISFYRVMITNDALPLLFWSFYLIMNKKFIKKLLLTVAIAIFCFIVFSRVLMVQFVLCLLVVGAVKIKNLEARSISFWFFMFGVFALGIFAVIGILMSDFGQQLLDAVYRRFLGSDAAYSDSFRTAQRKFLTQGFLQSPLWGMGTGSYVEECIRSEIAKFSYELEYLSFLYQFGILGFMLIICTTLYLVFCICCKSIRKTPIKIIVLFNIAIWAVKPFFNPGFLASNSGIVIAAIYICAMYCGKAGRVSLSKKEERKLFTNAGHGAKTEFLKASEC